VAGVFFVLLAALVGYRSMRNVLRRTVAVLYRAPMTHNLAVDLAVGEAVDRRTSRRPQRVLIVDDSPDIRELWRLWLTFWGFAVEEARNGSEALEKATAATPDLVLMDLWMPVLDGMEALKRLKSDTRTARVPVLALSAQSDAPDPSAVVRAGADAFVAKPCDPDLLLEHIRSAMRRLRPA